MGIKNMICFYSRRYIFMPIEMQACDKAKTKVLLDNRWQRRIQRNVSPAAPGPIF